MPESKAKRRIRVLLVGLAKRDATELETILSGSRPQIIPAETCVDAWKRLHECSFDVLVIDEAVDEGGWRDVVSEVASMGLALPVVLASAKPDNHVWVEALSAGVYDVLETPFPASETVRVLTMASQQGSPASARARRGTSGRGNVRRRAAICRRAAVLLPA